MPFFWLFTFGVVLAALACTNNGSRTVVAPGDAATPVASVSAAVSTRGAPFEDGLFALVSEQRWAAAAEWFDKHWVARQPRPKLRFLRAVLAAELGEDAQTIRWLSKLEAKLPVLTEEIQRLRLAAAAKLLPTEQGAVKLAQSERGSDVVRAVEALRRLERPSQALSVLVDRLPALRRKGGASSQDVLALRRAQADLLAGLSRVSEAAAIYKELATAQVTGSAARGTDAEYEKYSKVLLTKAQRFARAERFSKAKQLELFEAELVKMRGAPGKPVDAVTVKRSRAWAHYQSRRDYGLAAKLFFETSKADKTYRAQDLFYSARALSRAHQDETAAARYLSLARTQPKSRYAEQARYRAARLDYIRGEFKKAELGYLDYLKRYNSTKRSAKYASDVRYELSVSRLAQGKGRLAIDDLQRLVEQARRGRDKAPLMELLALAHKQANQHDEAFRWFRAVIEERPLSFSALVSATRLREMKIDPPPAIVSSPQGPAPKALTLKLPEKVSIYLELGLHLAAERELDEQSNALAKLHAPDSGRALCQAYSALNTAGSRYKHGIKAVRERALMRAIGPDTQWIWDCIYPRPYQNWVAEQERSRDVPAGLIHAVMRQESAFKSTVVSPAGAVGLMQLMPQTAQSIARELGREPRGQELTAPALNIEFGAFYLAKLLKRFSGNVPIAVASYNAGPAALTRWLKGAEQLPLDLFVARIPYDETRGYVYRVIGNLARYRYLSSGIGAVPQLAIELPVPRRVSGADY